MRYLIIATLIMLACACSKPDAEKNREALDQTKGEWTHDQTDKAIDIYLNVLKQQEVLVNKEIELRKTLNFYDESRCARDVLKSRQKEIQTARRRLEQKQDSLIQLSR
ncbi:MAG: hypothetical protein NC217_06925 [Muribaculaceae bacterium]|nr:hypothetical protein [Muribaculaceae bacterium]